MQEAIPYLSARPRFPPPGIEAADERPLSAPGGLSTSPADSSSSSSASLSGGDGEGAGGMRRLVAENPAVVLARRGCCMGHVARRLLLGLGVNPAVCEVGEEAAAEAAALAEGAAEIEVAGGDLRRPLILPVVFVGGKLLGGLDRLLAVHITGELVPILKQAGALWL
ncbi:monothiol glutaredoxin-S3-like [Zingiber officinale]|uniref:monothiol glutaredoxin-S3-like n=1 Tax=Zingiber officinale TaxID=94328 RepID=UPI001C4C7AED|nr:monothiol glutaredoxin-S3-like [Zingiber officinale]XP_042397427.1 monothiol glutaredoxin-S3-like [Zingiber officinale]